MTTLLAVLLTGPAQALETRGHTKLRATATDLPDNSLLQDFSDDPMTDSGAELRLNLSDRSNGFSWRADYQLLAVQGDRLELRQQTGLTGFGGNALPDDDLRLFDLTHTISERDDRVVSHRLDRFYLSHTTDKTVLNFGRQAISWGNGLIYNPVDFFNPFDPAAIDTEYKTGDDMLYTQYLFDSGDDLQAVWVARRDEKRDVKTDVSSLAFKYHGFADDAEFDLLLAEHYDDAIVALGGSIDIAEAIWRGDILITDTADDSYTSAVLNWSYSWIAWSKNLNASLEYYHNGFGIDDGDYGPAALADNPDLLKRLQRGELFTLGKNYLAAAATIELAPLWLLTTTLFRNLDDESSLLQVFSQHDLQQDLQLLIALNLPHGDDGSEFGGIDSAVPDRPLSIDESLFLQLAWYF
ncbi:MAG: hypothetical protein EP300_04070 [Gammaproteobacteria bacterium]|nr:MAG: hypothetical protein EP300_04070 [Gammaproteobacteria bacterium]